jgi:hypothetical protein
MLAGAMLIAVAGCAGDDLLLPGDDRTPTQLRAVSGDGQTAPAGTPVLNPLVVEALDRAGRPVEGAAIVFEFVDPPTDAEIAPSVSSTDASGRAAVEVTLGTPAGDQPVVARLEEAATDLSVRFALTAIQVNNPGGGGDDDDDPPPDDDGGGDGGGNGNGGGNGGHGNDDDDEDDDDGRGDDD